ncbi:MAG TPA: hotdog fold domain-containing protein [Pseudonocardiaceae bacterium]|nr:hotdog fold domain-containing protein [Pseudonocardiaceae bacterium]
MTTTRTPWPPGAAEPAQRHPDAPAPGTPMGPHYVNCFGCGPDRPGGLRLRTMAGEGLTVFAEFVVTDAHQGAPGLAHGGLLAAAFDEALGALGALLRVPAVTGKLETDFRKPVPVGSTLHIAAKVDGISGRKIYNSAVGRLDAPDGPVAVQARALFVTVGMEHFTAHGTPEDIERVFGRVAEKDGQDYEINP